MIKDLLVYNLSAKAYGAGWKDDALKPAWVNLLKKTNVLISFHH